MILIQDVKRQSESPPERSLHPLGRKVTRKARKHRCCEVRIKDLPELPPGVVAKGTDLIIRVRQTRAAEQRHPEAFDENVERLRISPFPLHSGASSDCPAAS